MQNEKLIKGLREVLLSLPEDELKLILKEDILVRIRMDWEKIKNKTDPKANVWDRLKDLGIERFNDAKESLTETVTKFTDQKEEVKKEEEIVHNNPFKKMQQQSTNL